MTPRLPTQTNNPILPLTNDDHTHRPPTEFVQALRIARTSGLVMLFTFACTLILSLEDGLVYGIMASLATLLYQLSDVSTYTRTHTYRQTDAQTTTTF